MMRSLHAAVLACALFGASTSHADYIDHFANPDDIGVLKVPRAGTTRVLVLPVIIDDQGFDQGSEAAFLARSPPSTTRQRLAGRSHRTGKRLASDAFNRKPPWPSPCTLRLARRSAITPTARSRAARASRKETRRLLSR